MEWQENNSRLHRFTKNFNPMPLEISFSRPVWVKLSCLQTGIGLLHSKTNKYGMAFTAACKCGKKEQTAEPVITSCSIYYNLNGAHVLSDVDKSLAMWLKGTCPAV